MELRETSNETDDTAVRNVYVNTHTHTQRAQQEGADSGQAPDPGSVCG